MRRTLRLAAADVMPSRRAVLAHQGIPPDAPVSDRILGLLGRAEELFGDCARPIGLISEVEGNEFRAIFEGEGNNERDAVVGLLVAGADRLALYAATMGREVSDRIEGLFADHEFALGSMLDSVASIAAECSVDACAEWYRVHLIEQQGLGADTAVLGYSPGYCGWDISGQHELFARLRPESIGISLNSSSMMSPLKSVSGVLLAARPEVHVFSPRFSYCPDCRQRSCIGRMRPLREALRGA